MASFGNVGGNWIACCFLMKLIINQWRALIESVRCLFFVSCWLSNTSFVLIPHRLKDIGYWYRYVCYRDPEGGGWVAHLHTGRHLVCLMNHGAHRRRINTHTPDSVCVCVCVCVAVFVRSPTAPASAAGRPMRARRWRPPKRRPNSRAPVFNEGRHRIAAGAAVCLLCSFTFFFTYYHPFRRLHNE